MAVLESRDVCEIVPFQDDGAFREFAAKNPYALAMISEEYGEPKQVVVKSQAGALAKWIRGHRPEIDVVLDTAKPRLDLRSSDIWLPLVFVANSIGLPVFLNLVSSFVFDRMRGHLKGDKTRVHVSAVFEDRVSGTVKRFNFDGDSEALQKAILQFDLNEYFDERRP